MDKISIYESNDRVAVICQLPYVIDKNGIISIQSDTKEYIEKHWMLLDTQVGREKVLSLIQKSLNFE